MIYLDYAATTPLHPQVLQSMLPHFAENFGNPSSTHHLGQKAEAALETARETIARILQCPPQAILFTSGGTESDNLALRGIAFRRRAQTGADEIILPPTEHAAITETARQLQQHHGFRITWLPVDEYGMVHPASVEEALSPQTALVSVMYANNEIGTINPIPQIAAACHAQGIPLHTDAVQAAAYLPVHTPQLGADLISLGAHKFYGPKGIGALYLRPGISLLPTQTGGSHEANLRAGTPNIPLIVGFAEALRLAEEERPQRLQHLQPLRDEITETILQNIPQARLTGHPTHRMPNHASFVFKDVEGNTLLTLLDEEGFACSSASACKTGNPQPSPVIQSIHLPSAWQTGSLRVTLGIHTTRQEVTTFLQALPRLVQQARKLSAL